MLFFPFRAVTPISPWLKLGALRHIRVSIFILYLSAFSRPFYNRVSGCASSPYGKSNIMLQYAYKKVRNIIADKPGDRQFYYQQKNTGCEVAILTNNKAEARLFSVIMMLHVVLGFCVLVFTIDAIVVVRILFDNKLKMSNLWLWLELVFFIFICVYSIDTLRKYKMREYANLKLGLDNMKLTDSINNCCLCNSIPRYIINVGNFLHRIPPNVKIVCTSCGCYGDQYGTASEAIFEWNAGSIFVSDKNHKHNE